ncbi:DsbA family protein, partial [Ferrovibrio sp.]|uniref:DsbA family protein n=1 Tax=Ferrovibrio sp. TaxID=1917215 RepID=UPI0026088D37
MSPFRILAVAFVLLLALPTLAQVQTPAFPAEQRAAVRDVLVDNPEVLDVLLRHPEILQEASHVLAKKAEAQRQALTSNAKALFDDGVSYVAGNPKGDVTLVEFFDYRCPYCKQVVPAIQTLLKEDAKLRVVFKELPVLGPDSVIAARAAIAALQQDKGAKYLVFHHAMMDFRGQLTEAEVFRMAGASGLDLAKLKADMASPKVEQVIRANLALAEKLGINGTPGFVIGQELVPGAISLDAMRQLVKA